MTRGRPPQPRTPWPECAVATCDRPSTRLVVQSVPGSTRKARTYRCLDHVSRWDVVELSSLRGDEPT